MSHWIYVIYAFFCEFHTLLDFFGQCMFTMYVSGYHWIIIYMMSNGIFMLEFDLCYSHVLTYR